MRPRSDPTSTPIGTISDALFDPSLWRFLLFVGQPVRLAIAANVFMGRTLRSVAYDILRRAGDLVAWLMGKVQSRRLARFERHYFPLRRWHVVLAITAAVKLLQSIRRQWVDHTTGRAAQRRELQRKMRVAQHYK